MNYFIIAMEFSKWALRKPSWKTVPKDRLQPLLHALHRLRFASGLLLFAVLVGTVGYRIIENESWFDAYYMSLVTLSTVGFGEVIPLGHAGRVFTSFLILFNIGFFAYAVSSITSIFADRALHDYFFEFQMMQNIKKTGQHTIVCGYGRHAMEVCQELSKQKMPFVIIETDPAKIELLRQETSYLYIKGDATEDSVLMDAGIERASALVVTMPVDANNLFVVLSGRQINPNLTIISRLNNAADESKLRRAGANHVVMPEKIGGFYMATLINKPDLVEFFTLISNMGANQVVFEEIEVSRLKPVYHGQSIAAGGIVQATQIPIVGLRFIDGHYQLNPNAEEVLLPNMHIVVLGDPGQIKRFTDTVLEAPGGR